MPDFVAYGPWAALVAVAGLVGWAFRLMLTRLTGEFTFYMRESLSIQRAIRDEYGLFAKTILTELGKMQQNGRPGTPISGVLQRSD